MCDLLGVQLLGVHLLVVYFNLHSVQVQTSSRNVLAVKMGLVGVCLLVVNLNSTYKYSLEAEMY